MNDDLKSPVFQCRQCGDCCVRPRRYLCQARRSGGHGRACWQIPVAEFCRRFVEASALGPRLTVADGVCVFLMAGSLCRVHPVKPFICRQWPFLPALLVDPDELENAKTACPGLNPACTHEDFVEAALRQGAPEKDG